MVDFERSGERSRQKLLVICLSHYRAHQGLLHGAVRRTGASFVARELGFDRSHVSKLLSEARDEQWLAEDGRFGPRVQIPDGAFFFQVRTEDARRYGATGALHASQVRNLDRLRGEREEGRLVLSAKHLGGLVRSHYDTARKWLQTFVKDGLVQRTVRKGFASAYSFIKGPPKRSTQPTDRAPEPPPAMPDALPSSEIAEFASSILAGLSAKSAQAGP